MNKKGFTMVELLAVIAIIISIATSSVFILNKSVQNTKLSNLKTILTEIEIASDVYLSENESEMINVNTTGDTICTKLYVLQNDGLVDKNLIDPITNKAIMGTTCVYSCLHDGYLVHEIEGYTEIDNKKCNY